jgi:hypothetical protein
MDPTSNPFFVPHLPFYLFYLGFNWSINNDNIKTFSFFYFRFASFPGKLKICEPGITGKNLATLILDFRWWT